MTEKVGEDRKVEQHKEKKNPTTSERANDNKREKRGQMMTEDEASVELTRRCKGWFKGLLYGPKMLNTKVAEGLNGKN